MKLTKLHLFLIIIAVLVASTLGFSVKEYFENKEADYNQALDKGSNYDPFGNNDMSQDSENNYDTTIADLEDIVVPGRRERRHHHDSNGNHIPKHKHSGKKHHDKRNDDNQRNNRNADIPTQNSLANNTCNIDMSKYILKSEVVPPVCPKCPDSKSCPRQKPCQPCPPCARCPEPAFECKKVPNYNAISASNVNGILPMPRLNSFAQFN